MFTEFALPPFQGNLDGPPYDPRRYRAFEN